MIYYYSSFLVFFPCQKSKGPVIFSMVPDWSSLFFRTGVFYQVMAFSGVGRQDRLLTLRSLTPYDWFNRDGLSQHGVLFTNLN